MDSSIKKRSVFFKILGYLGKGLKLLSKNFNLKKMHEIKKEKSLNKTKTLKKEKT